MRSLILILIYLTKDVLRSWVTTPGAFFARILVTTALATLFLMVNAGFVLSERAIDQKIESMGVRTIFVSAPHSGSATTQASLAGLLAPLSDHGTYLPIKIPFIRGEIVGGAAVEVVMYREEALTGLVELIPELANFDSSKVLLMHGFPQGFEQRVDFASFRFDASTLAPTSVFTAISRNRPVLLLPEGGFSSVVGQSYQEAILLKVDDVQDIHMCVEVIKLLLESEGYERYSFVNAVDLLRELESMQAVSLKGRSLAGSMVALIIILVFGSIAVFEYRQNVFNFALIKSFGISAGFIALRYHLEALVLMAAAYGFSVTLGRLVHQDLFATMGFSRTLAASVDVYSISQTGNLIIILVASATIGSLPICFALRKPVGRVLS